MIEIGFSTSNAIYSRAIRWLTRSRVSHTFLLLSGSHAVVFGQPMVMEAASIGFRLIPLSVFKTQNTIVTLITPIVPLDEGVKKAAAWLGERYNYTGVVGMLVVLLGRWLGRKWRNPLRSAHSLFCSEVNTYVVQAVKYPDTMSLDPLSTDPEDLEEALVRTELKVA